MFLAIVGAALLINRGLSFILDQYVSIISSLVLIVYIKRFSFKDGLMMAVGIFFLSFMFGGTYVLLYAPLSILAGLVYGYGIERGFDSKRILFTLVILYTIGEFALTFIFLPMESISVKRHSGNNIASGIPGKPPPVPTSSISVWGWNGSTLAMASEWST